MHTHKRRHVNAPKVSVSLRRTLFLPLRHVEFPAIFAHKLLVLQPQLVHGCLHQRPRLLLRLQCSTLLCKHHLLLIEFRLLHLQVFQDHLLLLHESLLVLDQSL